MFRVYALISDVYGGQCHTRVGRRVFVFRLAVKQAKRYVSAWVTDDSTGRELPCHWHGELNRKVSVAMFERSKFAKPGQNMKGAALASWADTVQHGPMSTYTKGCRYA